MDAGQNFLAPVYYGRIFVLLKTPIGIDWYQKVLISIILGKFLACFGEESYLFLTLYLFWTANLLGLSGGGNNLRVNLQEKRAPCTKQEAGAQTRIYIIYASSYIECFAIKK